MPDHVHVEAVVVEELAVLGGQEGGRQVTRHSRQGNKIGMKGAKWQVGGCLSARFWFEKDWQQAGERGDFAPDLAQGRQLDVQA